ncbi:hypothetical protein BS50DRAFT_658609 [Corynespora cassiicola Philippines]|uniref:Wax synthase domain-containing protein n=1 Tax=Corynespora cassiicola Philippines TaxID=1448308 RepID=A0A2T2P4Q2_CORCC|nr:hypothetical protein BS50DRAFT_658609 [Corynespora cassiicola Philippines]
MAASWFQLAPLSHHSSFMLSLFVILRFAFVEPPNLERLTVCNLNSASLPSNESRSSSRITRTFDIIWTSLVTIGISTYTMLSLNILAPDDRFFTLVGRRIPWMILGIIGPEFPLTYAAGQWSRAKQSVHAFRASGYDDWHMRQTFFTDMGGFVLHARDDKAFPLNSNQLHWLVVNNFVEYPKISRRKVWDKSKQDTFTKVVTAFQVGYLIIQCIGRAAKGLAITALELNAVAVVITLNRSCNLTPLGFVDENEPGYSVNVQPFMKMPVIPPERPIQRIPNDRFPTNPYGAQKYLLCFVTLLFTAIHVAGWNFDFPTEIEKLFWRISSLLLFSITVAFWFFETIASWIRLGRWKTIHLHLFNKKGLESHRRRMTMRQMTAVKRQMTELPQVWEFIAITPLAIVYGIARLYLLAEAFAELRDIKVSAYVNVEWTNFIPHV